MAGPTTTTAWEAVERSAIALGSSSNGTSVGVIDRIAGLPTAAEQPLANERARKGQSWFAPLMLTTSRRIVITASTASEPM